MHLHEFALREMIEKHGCHTVILYGSRARGDWTEESDLDIVGIRKTGEKYRDARVFEGVFLDAFVYSEAEVIGHESEHLSLRGGKILVENEGMGSSLLNALDEIFSRGPKPLPLDEIQVRRVWIEKMLARISRGDIEGNFRRVWLQFDLLENYFAFRKLWYLGPKESFRWLSKNDPETLSAYEAVLRPNSTLAELTRLAELVLGH